MAGLWLPILWAGILTVWEAFMLRYPIMVALLLPYYAWHAYMLVRGAPAIATVPFSYAFYVSAFVFLVIGRRFVWVRPHNEAASDPQPDQILQGAR
jgi:hypothetical protein